MGVRESPSWGVNSVGNFTDSPYTWTGNEVDGKSCKSTFSRPMITGTGFDLEKKKQYLQFGRFFFTNFFVGSCPELQDVFPFMSLTQFHCASFPFIEGLRVYPPD